MKRIFIGLFTVGVVVLGLLKLQTPAASQVKSVLTPTSLASPKSQVLKPVLLEIPKLTIKSEIEYVGEDLEGRMDVPKNAENVAWWKLGSLPGEKGSAVLAGHLDSPTGPAVFYELDKLKTGDEVIITDEANQTLIFEVTDKQIYKDESFPIKTVFEQNDTSRLNLITCAGSFDKTTKRYSDRTVIFTKLVEN